MRKSILGLAVAASLASTSATAAIDSYAAYLYGANEVGAGDPDGFGIATVVIDNVANTVSWSILALNIVLPLSGSHIHDGDAGTNGPVIVDFSGALSGSGLFDTDLAFITPMSASGFYVNVHNSVYPGGAIRGQLEYVGTAALPIPEPATYALLLSGLGVVGAVARRRRVAAA